MAEDLFDIAALDPLQCTSHMEAKRLRHRIQSRQASVGLVVKELEMLLDATEEIEKIFAARESKMGRESRLAAGLPVSRDDDTDKEGAD